GSPQRDHLLIQSDYIPPIGRGTAVINHLLCCKQRAGAGDARGLHPTVFFEDDVKQVRHYLRNGALDIGEVPMPAVGSGDVLVRSHYSFVSVGTEKMKVSQARMNLVEKAKERPDQVRLVLDTLREQGLMPTLRKVQER